MPNFTSRRAMYLPGGGSSGTIPDEALDVDKLNGNFVKLDESAFIPRVTSTTRPSTPFNDQIILEADTGNVMIYNQSASRWLPVGIPFASTDADRAALYPQPVQGDMVFRRKPKGYLEGYFEALNTTTNTGGREPAGWYPMTEEATQVATVAYGTFYQNHATWESLTLTRQGFKVRLKGTATIKQTVSFDAGVAYILGSIPKWLPPKGVFGALAVSPATTGWVSVGPTGQIEFSLATARPAQAANSFILGIDLEWTVTT